MNGYSPGLIPPSQYHCNSFDLLISLLNDLQVADTYYQTTAQKVHVFSLSIRTPLVIGRTIAVMGLFGCIQLLSSKYFFPIGIIGSVAFGILSWDLHQFCSQAQRIENFSIAKDERGETFFPSEIIGLIHRIITHIAMYTVTGFNFRKRLGELNATLHESKPSRSNEAAAPTIGAIINIVKGVARWWPFSTGLGTSQEKTQ